MMDFLLLLIIASFTGSSLWILLNCIRPVTQKVFSQTWHYYTGVLPLFFFLGGSGFITRLIQLASSLQSNRDPGPLRSFTNDYLFPLAVEGKPLTNRLFTLLSHLKNHKEILLLTLFIWAAGIVIFLAMHLKKYIEFKSFILNSSRIVDMPNYPTKVMISDNATTPMVMGFWKPIVILPNIPLGDKELDMILTHELVHLKRGDFLVKLMMLIVKTVHWFNPLVYFLSRQLNTLCELSCDEKVVRDMDVKSRKCYGEVILSMLDYSVRKKNLFDIVCVSNLCHSKKNVKRRLVNLMNTKKTKKSIITLSIAATIALAGIGVYAGYTAEASVPEVFNSYKEDPNYLIQGGRNISIVSLDGTAITYDQEGNLVQTKPKGYDLPKELTYEEIMERIKLHEEKGIPVPEAYLNAVNKE